MRNIKRIYAVLTAVTVLFSYTSVFAEDRIENSLPEPAENTAIEYFVATSGNDSNPGTADLPFKTFDGAKNAIRNLKNTSGLPKGGITVNVRGGSYDFTEYSFVLDKEDSGSEDCPIVYKRYMDEKVILNGGYSVNLNQATPVTDKALLNRLISNDAKANVRQINFAALGITVSPIITKGYGVNMATEEYPEDGIQRVGGLSPQIYLDDSLMDLARYPNRDADNRPQAMLTGTVLSGTEEQSTSAEFKYTDKRVESWQDTGNIWAFGWWNMDWAENCNKVSINKADGTVSLSGYLAYGVRKDRRFYMENIFEELDHDNEYFYDYDTGIFYFYQNPSKTPETLEVAHNKNPLVDFNDVSYVTFSGFNLKNSSGYGIYVWGGHDVTIAYNEIKNIAIDAIKIAYDEKDTAYDWDLPYTPNQPVGCYNLNIVSNHIYNIGSTGISVRNGAYYQLKHSNTKVENNEIHRFGQIKRTYQDAVKLGAACGVTVAYNKIYDAPHEGIAGYWTECIIEFNDISDVCQETGDCGAIYTYHRNDSWGNVVRYNYIHDMVVDESLGLGSTGVYVDGNAVGFEVYGNIFEKIQRSILFNGGVYNSAYNNLTVNCQKAIDYNDIGISLGLSLKNNMKKLKEFYENEKAWQERYPILETYFRDDFDDRLPIGGVVKNNIGVGSKSTNTINAPVITYGEVSNNVLFESDPGFVNMKKGNFTLTEDSEVWEKVPEFKNIPWGRIGLYGSYVVSKMQNSDCMLVGSGRLFTKNVLTSMNTENKDAVVYTDGGKVYIPKEALNLLGVSSDTALTLEETAQKLNKKAFYDEKTGLIMLGESDAPFNKKTDESMIEEAVRQLTIR